MNKKEFYKELMKSYTIDTEKIKCNAKRKVPLRTAKTGNVRRWVTSFAACAAAAAVAVVSLSFFNNSGVDIKEPNLDMDIQRVYAAEARFQELAEKYSTLDMYLSFENELKLNEVLIAFSAIDEDGDIKLALLYTKEGKCYKNDGRIGENLKFLGAKISAPTRLYEELNGLKCIALAETVEGSKYNDKSFVPYSKPKEVSPDTIPETIVVPIPPENITTAEKTEAPPETAASESPATDITTITSEPPAQTSVTEITTESSSAVTEPEIIEIPAVGVIEAKLISESCLIVTTNDSIMLYKLSNGALSLETTFYASGARLAWINSDESMLFITACDSNGRNRLFYADGSTETLTALDLNSITAGAEIASVVCSDDGSLIIIKTVSIDKTYIYYAQRNGSEITLTLAKEYGTAASALTYSEGYIYFAVTDAAGTAVTVNKVNLSNGAEQAVIAEKGSVRCIRSNTLDAAILIFTDQNGENGKYKLLTPEGNLVDVNASGDVYFSASGNKMFRIGDRYFSYDTGSVIEINDADAKNSFIVKADSVREHTVSINENGVAVIVKNNP